jgi:hypothetical protein
MRSWSRTFAARTAAVAARNVLPAAGQALTLNCFGTTTGGSLHATIVGPYRFCATDANALRDVPQSVEESRSAEAADSQPSKTRASGVTVTVVAARAGVAAALYHDGTTNHAVHFQQRSFKANEVDDFAAQVRPGVKLTGDLIEARTPGLLLLRHAVIADAAPEASRDKIEELQRELKECGWRDSRIFQSGASSDSPPEAPMRLYNGKIFGHADGAKVAFAKVGGRTVAIPRCSLPEGTSILVWCREENGLSCVAVHDGKPFSAVAHRMGQTGMVATTDDGKEVKLKPTAFAQIDDYKSLARGTTVTITPDADAPAGFTATVEKSSAQATPTDVTWRYGAVCGADDRNCVLVQLFTDKGHEIAVLPLRSHMEPPPMGAVVECFAEASRTYKTKLFVRRYHKIHPTDLQNKTVKAASGVVTRLAKQSDDGRCFVVEVEMSSGERAFTYVDGRSMLTQGATLRNLVALRVPKDEGLGMPLVAFSKHYATGVPATLIQTESVARFEISPTEENLAQQPRLRNKQTAFSKRLLNLVSDDALKRGQQYLIDLQTTTPGQNDYIVTGIRTLSGEQLPKRERGAPPRSASSSSPAPSSGRWTADRPSDGRRTDAWRSNAQRADKSETKPSDKGKGPQYVRVTSDCDGRILSVAPNKIFIRTPEFADPIPILMSEIGSLQVSLTPGKNVKFDMALPENDPSASFVAVDVRLA